MPSIKIKKGAKVNTVFLVSMARATRDTAEAPTKSAIPHLPAPPAPASTGPRNRVPFLVGKKTPK